MTYLLTFACYGSHLAGEHDGVVDHKRNCPGQPYEALNQQRAEAYRARLRHEPYQLDLSRARLVLEAMVETCQYRRWHANAFHVRTNHVHAVIHADEKPEKVMNDLKAYASRRLNEHKVDPPETIRWARHGSTRYLFDDQAVTAAIRYVVYEQSNPMAVYENPARSLTVTLPIARPDGEQR